MTPPLDLRAMSTGYLNLAEDHAYIASQWARRGARVPVRAYSWAAEAWTAAARAVRFGDKENAAAAVRYALELSATAARLSSNILWMLSAPIRQRDRVLFFDGAVV